MSGKYRIVVNDKVVTRFDNFVDARNYMEEMKLDGVIHKLRKKKKWENKST